MKVSDFFGGDSRVSFVDEARQLAASCNEDFRLWWNRADQGDWLMWVAGKLGARLELLVHAAACCARSSLRFLPVDEKRPRKAIELADKWARGEASASECAEAADRLTECMSADSYGGGLQAAAAMTAVAAAEAAVNAAGQSHDKTLSATLAAIAARRAAGAAKHKEGLEAMREANANCACIVRNIMDLVETNGVWHVIPRA